MQMGSLVDPSDFDSVLLTKLLLSEIKNKDLFYHCTNKMICKKPMQFLHAKKDK